MLGNFSSGVKFAFVVSCVQFNVFRMRQRCFHCLLAFRPFSVLYMYAQSLVLCSVDRCVLNCKQVFVLVLTVYLPLCAIKLRGLGVHGLVND